MPFLMAPQHLLDLGADGLVAAGGKDGQRQGRRSNSERSACSGKSRASRAKVSAPEEARAALSPFRRPEGAQDTVATQLGMALLDMRGFSGRRTRRCIAMLASRRPSACVQGDSRRGH
jgi:hypothetical protein